MESRIKKDFTLPQLEYHLFEKQLKSNQPINFHTEKKDIDTLGKEDNGNGDDDKEDGKVSTFIENALSDSSQGVDILGSNTQDTDENDVNSQVTDELNLLSGKFSNVAVKIKDEFFLLAQALTNKILHETDALFEAVKEDAIGRAGLEVQSYSQQGQKLDKATQDSIVKRTVAHQKAASKNADLMFAGIQRASRDLGAKGYGYIGEGSAYMSQFKEWVQKGFTPTDNASERAEMEYYIKGLQGR